MLKKLTAALGVAAIGVACRFAVEAVVAENESGLLRKRSAISDNC